MVSFGTRCDHMVSPAGISPFLAHNNVLVGNAGISRAWSTATNGSIPHDFLPSRFFAVCTPPLLRVSSPNVVAIFNHLLPYQDLDATALVRCSWLVVEGVFRQLRKQYSDEAPENGIGVWLRSPFRHELPSQ